MAIVENRASEVGDVILIKASVPIIGLVTLASFVDSTVNESAAKFFTKEFRYATDGINFGPWDLLTNPNIAAINIEPTDTFAVEYRYTRQGTDSSQPDLEFQQVQITGDFTAIPCGETYDKSIFAQFFSCTDVCVLSWMINVLEKMYEEGILPKYIERGAQNNDARQDQDFIEFWKTIAQYFAYIVCYARKWEITNVTNNYEILIQYLRNQTFIFCGQENTAELKHVMNNTYAEMSHRGTEEIIKTKREDNKPIDGEWHRLFCHLEKCADWYFSQTNNYKIGWVGDQASPLYQGNYKEAGLTKGYEDTTSVEDLAAYPVITGGGVVTNPAAVNNAGEAISVLRIDNIPAGNSGGIGHTASPVATEELIKVSPYCEYEISFWVKMSDLDNLLTLGVQTYDENGNLLPAIGTSLSQSLVVSDVFAERVKVGRADKYYYFKAVIYGVNHQKNIGELEETSLSNGTRSSNPFLSLKFNSSEVCYISPKLILDNSQEGDISGAMDLYDIKVRHLRTSYATGFEQASGFIKMKVQNFNFSLTPQEAESFMREFLIPYNTTYKMEFISTAPKPALTLNDFDYLVVRYRWGDGGNDLDTRTAIRGTGDIAVDNKYVGWSFPSNIGAYLTFGGDETGSAGEENVLIDFNQLTTDYPASQKFFADLRAFWYGSKASGALEFEFVTYKGGTMIQIGKTFQNVGGTEEAVVTQDTILSLVRANLLTSPGTAPGELLGTIEYNPATRIANLIPA